MESKRGGSWRLHSAGLMAIEIENFKRLNAFESETRIEDQNEAHCNLRGNLDGALESSR